MPGTNEQLGKTAFRTNQYKFSINIWVNNQMKTHGFVLATDVLTKEG